MTVSVHSPYASPLTPPTSDLQAAAPSTDAPAPEAHHHALDMVALGLGGAALAVGLSGCGSTPPPPEPTISTTVPTLAGDHFTQDAVHPAVSLTDAGRVDVIRQTESHTDSNDESHDENVAYSPVGVGLGDGLFLDLNGTVTETDENHVTVQQHGLGTATTTITRNGDTVQVHEPGLFGGVNTTWNFAH